MIPNMSIEEAAFLREVIALKRTETSTDIEELDLLVNGGLQSIRRRYPTTAARFHNLMGMRPGKDEYSPILEAVKLKKAEVPRLLVSLT